MNKIKCFTARGHLYTRRNKARFADLRTEAQAFSATITDPALRRMWEQCFFNTLYTTTFFDKAGSPYVLTGDIPAMWLRDSSAQVFQYLFFARSCPSVRSFICGLLERQFAYIVHDPYANAFNQRANGNGHIDDIPIQSPLVWERKFELDSLCYPFWLLTKYLDATQDASCLTEGFIAAFDAMIATLRVEQHHPTQSTYSHTNPAKPHKMAGSGTPVRECGLVWSGYRPSDDKCTYGYFIPGNMMVVTVLYALEGIFRDTLFDSERAATCHTLYTQIQIALDEYAVVEKDGVAIYAYEVDALGNSLIMDDANIPSLFALPYTEYPFLNTEVYTATRRMLLSHANPYYFEGNRISGIGSPHGGGADYVWPMSVIIQALTTPDTQELNRLVRMVANSTGGTGYVHESVHKDDDKRYTRPWFAWANSLFAYLLLARREDLTFIRQA